MKWILVFLVGAIVSLGAGVSGHAESDETGKALTTRTEGAQTKRIKTTEPVKRFMGELVSLNVESRVLTAKGRKGGEFSFDISRARIARNTKLQDLKSGDRIGIVYIEKEGKKIAKAVGKPAVRAKRAKAVEEAPPVRPPQAQESAK